MMSEGGSSCTRPGRRSSSAIAGACDRDGVAPKCFCGVYAILYKSRTASNPNRIFFGCPFFKVKERCCRYFVWLDEHLKKIRAMESEALGAVDDVGGVDIEDHVVRSQELEEKIQLVRSQELEKKMKELERKLGEDDELMYNVDDVMKIAIVGYSMKIAIVEQKIR
ncbi:hypothetical protein Ahy_B07g087115 isoform A [Arachis hypogaea]|uniref:GRF-type domain-containing protein n=1 Tax=Arachis hypogaea TaxID=3818 RepID=A0A444YBC9_ARAHY|nr:hypothetical protein Ahy_B07g087115 isoform A [Arachis hypogaea]